MEHQRSKGKQSLSAAAQKMQEGPAAKGLKEVP